MIEVSIIVPVYNTAKYLRKCLDSLVMQDATNVNYELIVVNDGSPDESDAIIKEYQEKYSNLITYVKKENGGLSSARNEGLKYAEGNYILFIDSDDYVDTKLLSTFVSENNDYDLFVYGYTNVYENDFEKNEQHAILNSKVMAASESINMFFENSAVRGYAWNKIFKKSIILNNNITYDPKIKYIEDLPFTIEYLSKSDTVYFSSATLYYYLQREGSLINSSFNANKMFALMGYDKILPIIKKINSEYLATFYYFVFEINYELSIRIRISNESNNFINEYKVLKNNIKFNLNKFIFKNVKWKYKIKALIKYLFYEVILLKYGVKNAKN